MTIPSPGSNPVGKHRAPVGKHSGPPVQSAPGKHRAPQGAASASLGKHAKPVSIGAQINQVAAKKGANYVGKHSAAGLAARNKPNNIQAGHLNVIARMLKSAHKGGTSHLAHVLSTVTGNSSKEGGVTAV